MTEPSAPVITEPDTSTPRKRWPLIAAIAGGAVIVLAVVLFFVLRGGGGSGTQPSAETPAFTFQLVGSKAISTVDHADKGADAGVAEKSAGEIRDVLDRMYSLAFLDPANWKSGSYDNVFGFFDIGAVQQRAKADVATLTLGTDAGKSFTDVQPSGGKLGVQVLVDKGGRPVSAIANVVFKARATGTAKSGEIVVSKGHYFMHILEGGWTIFAYRVTRHDQPLTAKSTAGATP